MDRLHQYLTLLCIAGTYSAADQSGFRQGISQRVSSFDDKIMTTNVQEKYSDINSVTHCSILCFSDTRCGSFFYVKSKQICQLHVVLFITPSDAGVEPGSTYFKITQEWCPSDYVLHRPLALCYKIYNELLEYTNATSACQSEGGTLAVIKDNTSFSHVYEFLRASSGSRLTHYRIGADDLSVEGQVVWVDGTPATWTNWAKDEPSHRTERCLAMAWFFYFKWNDVPCDLAMKFLCQIKRP